MDLKHFGPIQLLSERINFQEKFQLDNNFVQSAIYPQVLLYVLNSDTDIYYQIISDTDKYYQSSMILIYTTNHQ